MVRPKNNLPSAASLIWITGQTASGNFSCCMNQPVEEPICRINYMKSNRLIFEPKTASVCFIGKLNHDEKSQIDRIIPVAAYFQLLLRRHTGYDL